LACTVCVSALRSLAVSKTPEPGIAAKTGSLDTEVASTAAPAIAKILLMGNPFPKG
jgi:hypothetical protein